MNQSDTIFALASGYGRAAIAVIRLSGPQTENVLRALLRGVLPPPRRASLRRLHHPGTGDILDQALVLWLPGPGSFTGEDQAELHIHGGVAVRGTVVAVLSRLPGCRAAEPGEFTRRAFLSQRLDLSAVEGLADLIEAETEAQRRQAMRQLEGALAQEVASWREALIDASAFLEAALDFTDEEDVPADIVASGLSGIRSVHARIDAALADASRGERLREGFVVVIAGPPNAGKSTLLNALARRDVAIVSAIPGTTRDAIEVRCDLAGLPVTFVDTAGLRETADPVEHAGIERTRAHIGAADLVLWLAPADEHRASGPISPSGVILRRPAQRAVSKDAPGLVRGSRRGFAAPDHEKGGVGPPVLAVVTKADLADGALTADTSAVAISAQTGFGLDRLIERVRHAAEAGLSGGDALITRERHRVALEEVAAALGRAEAMLQTGRDELAAEDLRLALRALGRITGQVDVEEVLDRIFGQFCIGK